MASGQVIGKFFPGDNEPPAASAVYDTRNGRPLLRFDGAAALEAVFTDVLSSYAGGGMMVDSWWMLTSAVAGSFTVEIAFERFASSLDGDTDSFAASKSGIGSVPATAGAPALVQILFTNGAEIDGLLDGEPYRLKVRRGADGLSSELFAVVVREA